MGKEDLNTVKQPENIQAGCVIRGQDVDYFSAILEQWLLKSEEGLALNVATFGGRFPLNKGFFRCDLKNIWKTSPTPNLFVSPGVSA